MIVTRDTVLTYAEGIPDNYDWVPASTPDPRVPLMAPDIARRFNNFIPQKLITENRLSTTSAARDCYVLRRNSRKLQELMIDFAYNMTKTYGVTQEI